MKRFGPINGRRFPPFRVQWQKNPTAPPHPEWATCRSVQESPLPADHSPPCTPLGRPLSPSVLHNMLAWRGCTGRRQHLSSAWFICWAASRRVTGRGGRRRKSDTFCKVMQSDTTAWELIPPYCVELLLPFDTGDGCFLLLFELFSVSWCCKAILKSAESCKKWESASKSNCSQFILGNQTYIKVIRLEKPICKVTEMLSFRWNCISKY